MEFGSKEWFKKLEEMCKFPNVFAFYVSSDMNIYSKVVETKADNLANVMYKMLEPSLFLDDTKTALASLKRCNSSQEYYEESLRLREIWSNEGKETVKA